MNEIKPVIEYYTKLQKDILKVESTSTHLDGDETYITIKTKIENGTVEFVFKIETNKDTQSDVFEITNIALESFKLESQEENLEFKKDILNDFNKTYENSFLDAIGSYVDIESELSKDNGIDEQYRKAISIIENMGNELNNEKFNPNNIVNNILDNLNDNEKQKIFDYVMSIISKKINIDNLKPLEIAQIGTTLARDIFRKHLMSANE